MPRIPNALRWTRHLQGHELAAPFVNHAPDSSDVTATQHGIDGHQGIVEVRDHFRRVSQYEEIFRLLVILHLEAIDHDASGVPSRLEGVHHTRNFSRQERAFVWTALALQGGCQSVPFVVARHSSPGQHAPTLVAIGRVICSEQTRTAMLYYSYDVPANVQGFKEKHLDLR